ncbi:MAG: 4Fe-4S dicluster domain-containing protein [Candidatus Muiribacteriota bacterium]
MLEKILEAGIIGAGGAGFPTHIKLKAEADFFIINAAECEPLLYSDRTLMLQKPEQIIKGIELIKKIIKFKKAFIGIKKKNSDCAELLNKYNKSDDIEIKILSDTYPSGDEQVLIYETLHKIVPEKGIPLDINVIVNNVETVYRIYNALENKEPFSKRFVTVTGDIKKPYVAEIPVGTPFKHLLNIAGNDLKEDYVAVDGGPMMGQIKNIEDSFVTRKTSGVLFLNRNHPLVMKKNQNLNSIISQAASACCNCITCTELCSRYMIGHDMQPHKIMRAIFSKNINAKIFDLAHLCSECNICELYACPLNLSPKTVNSYIKNEYYKQGKKVTFKQRELVAPEFREGRKIPSKRLINRLGLIEYYNKKVEFIEKFIIPDFLQINLDDNIGKPSTSVVKENQSVSKFDLIAQNDGDFSANVHINEEAVIKSVSDNKIIAEVIK